MLKSQQKRVGSTNLQVVSLGDNASAFPAIKGLNREHFYVGEVVSVRRTDGMRTIAQVLKNFPEYILVNVGNGMEKNIPSSDISECVCKLLGAVALDHMNIRTIHDQSEMYHPHAPGQSLVLPARIGQSCSSNICLKFSDLDQFYHEELVAVFTERGGCIGIIRISNENEPSIDFGGSCGRVSGMEFNSLEIHKLAGVYYLCEDMMPPNIILGSSTYSGLVRGQQCDWIHRSKAFGYDAFYVNEVVAVKVGTGRVCGIVKSVTTNRIMVQIGPNHVECITDSAIAEICKLDGFFFVSDTSDWLTVRFDFHSEVVWMGLTMSIPISPGILPQNHTLPIISSYARHYKGEIVVVRFSDHLEVGRVWDAPAGASMLAVQGVQGIAQAPLSAVDKIRAQVFFADVASPAVQTTRCITRIGPSSMGSDGLATSQNGFVEILACPSRALRRAVHTKQLIESQILQGLGREHQTSGGRLAALFRERVPEGDKMTFVDLLSALRGLGILVDHAELEHFFALRGRSVEGSFDLDDLKLAVENRWAVDAWAESLPLWQLLADALPYMPDCHRLRVVSSMTEKEIQDVCEGVCRGMLLVLKAHVLKLRKSFKSMDSQAANQFDRVGLVDKFQYEVLEMHCGKIDDFYRMGNRVGPCHLDFLRGMELEHCTNVGHDVQFKSTNFDVLTTPYAEWLVVKEKKTPDPAAMALKRRLVDYERLRSLDLAIVAKLIDPEIIAIVLYSGPMFHVYNTILREFPKDLLSKLKTPENPYPFSTTIHVLASAVQKIARVTKLSPGLVLYRGLGGNVTLPQQFCKLDDKDRRGFTEWGFMSTTTERDVAFQYSGLKGRCPLPMVLEICVGSVDRGACIRDFSQYPHEMEYLFVPGSFVEQARAQYVEVTKTGVVTVIPVRVNMNLKTQTVEERLKQKKSAHTAAFRYSLDEMDEELRRLAESKNAEGRLNSDLTRFHKDRVTVEYSLKDFLKRIIDQCKEVCTRHEGIKAEEYSHDKVYQSLVLEMADIRQLARSKLEEWLENKSNSFIRYRMNAPLKAVHRRRIVFLESLMPKLEGDEKAGTAAKICKLKGLIVNEPTEYIGEDAAKETALMKAAAEGRHEKDLAMLVEAKADVDATRKDGVSAIWLAAQFGHEHCIEGLHKLRANVNHCSKDHASPLYIASQSGHVGCVETLHRLGANLDLADDNGLTAVHQAAMNGHLQVLRKLWKLEADMRQFTKQGKTALSISEENNMKQCSEFLANEVGGFKVILAENKLQMNPLILCTVDLSNLDGHCALGSYSRTGADVLFIMNYPSFVAVGKDSKEERKDFGFGHQSKLDEDGCAALSDLISKMDGSSSSELNVKLALTQAFFQMATACWNAVRSSVKKGRLFFCTGGVNELNPDGPEMLNREVSVFQKRLGHSSKIPIVEGIIFNSLGAEEPRFALRKYEKIYLACTGSLAFFDATWSQKLSEPEIVQHIAGAVVACGVGPRSPIPTAFNCLRCASKNQLFHPSHAAAFFQFLRSFKIPTYLVASEEAVDLVRSEEVDGKKVYTFEGVDSFLKSNELDVPLLTELSRDFGREREDALQRPHNFFAAEALHIIMASDQAPRALALGEERHLYFDEQYGLSLLAAEDDWDKAREAYAAASDTAVAEEDRPEARVAKERMARELTTLRQFTFMASLGVRALRFGAGERPHLR